MESAPMTTSTFSDTLPIDTSALPLSATLGLIRVCVSKCAEREREREREREGGRERERERERI